MSGKASEKLNLDRLGNWSTRNATMAKELMLAHHNIFALDSNELGCTSEIEHEIHLADSELFRERFWCIPPLLPEEVCDSLRDMLEAGQSAPANHHGPTRWF